jgi:magnesium chelatase subunit D
VTDGRHTAGGEPSTAAGNLRGDGIASVVVDCESGPVRLGLAAGLAQALGAEYLTLDGLSAERLADSVRGWRADRVHRPGPKADPKSGRKVA